MNVIRFFGAALLLFVSTIGHADTLKFTLSGQENGFFLFSSNPTPDSFGDNVMNFYNTSYTNSADVISLIKVTFFSTLYGGGFSDELDGDGFQGKQIYTGTQASPIFSTGVFTFKSGRTVIETLTITKLVAVTPEPSSLLLVFSGLSAAGVAVRKRYTGQSDSLA
jgi:hypothetical protein